MTKLVQAIASIDAYNDQDPNQESDQGDTISKELLYARRMTAMLHEYLPAASEELQIAARAQHIGRWQISRDKYPEGRKGYLTWRNQLKAHHAKVCGQILEEIGYTSKQIERVQFLIEKKALKADAETQALEDVICLVFLQHYALDFAQKHPTDKVIKILKKTWRKMSSQGQSKARALKLPDAVKKLVLALE